MQHKLIYILLTLASVITYGQVNLSMDADKTEYAGKDIINLTIVLELNGSDLVQQTGFQLPDLSKFNIIGSGSVTNTVIDPATNTLITQKVSRIALEPKKKGKIKIGSVLVTVNNRIYKTEPFDVNIRDIVDRRSLAANTSNDVYLNMEIDDRDVYQDQPTVAVLRVYSRNMDNLRKVKNIHLPQQDNINVHPINFNKSEIDPSGYGNMPSQVLAMFMVFPNEAGYVEVPGVSASVSTYSNKTKIVSNKVRINVRKLPEGAPECFKNAVGNFNVNVYNASKEKPEAKKPLNVVVKVSGEGNLPDMELPKIAASPDYEVFAPKITSKVAPGTSGMKGEILANYVIIPKKSGVISIKTEQFAFFDPESKEYVDLGQKTLDLNAFSHDQILEARSTVEKVNEYTNNLLETVNTPVLKTTSFKVKEKSKFHWNILLTNIAILISLFVAYLLFKNWQKKRTLVRETVPSKPLGSVAETEKEIRELMKTDINDYFGYLENLKDNGEYEKFFVTLEELDEEVRSQYFQGSTPEFKTFLEKHKGSSVADEYSRLQQKVQMEKYNPVKSAEALEELLKTIVNLYSQISK
ncbi:MULTISPECIES: BatD family protein [Chryseobacterium]|uniref:BatD family protein n=1 Tax=Chryseobacterium TaxID=59732 RepID=UPI00192D821F|nr:MULTISPECIES: BatD family protein [Chryseobacterium]MCC3216213.1 BatD family protein [Chryseobacterium sp. X308]QRA41728.1 BatD family protein [Chryseobacterium cucumeris]